jgi:hypothetical protein
VIATLLLLLAAATASHALPVLLGLTPNDPLRSTVALLPLVLAGLLLAEGAARRRGIRRPRRGAVPAQLVALAAWLLLVAVRARLALPLAPALAATLFALLGVHVLSVLPTLRPLLRAEVDGGERSSTTPLGPATPPRPPAIFFWLPLLAYVAILPWSTAQRPPDGDEPYYLLVTHSLAHDLDADLANQYAHGDSLAFMPRRLQPQPGDPVGPHGERYSRHNVLLPLLLALPYRLAGARGAFLTMAALTAALCWQTLRLMRDRFPRSPDGALLAWSLLAFTPPLLLYSHQVWVEVPAALLVGAALDAMSRPPSRRTRLAFWSSVVALPLLKLRFAVLAPLLALLGWWRGERRARVLVGAALGLGGLLAAILLFNELRFGSALKTYGLDQLLPDAGAAVVLARVLGLFFDVAFGLFAVAPLWALLLPASLHALRARERLLAEVALLAAPYALLVAFRREWYGGWSPPFRYGLAMLPVLALLLAPLLERRGRGGARLAVGALGGATAALALLWLAVPGWTYDLADGSTLLLHALGAELRLDVARLFPSAVRLRDASWWWPPLALALVSALWWWPRRAHHGLLRAGVALAILAPAAAVAAAATLPTRVIEPEDGQVRTVGGSLYPPRWTFDRLRFHGGWQLVSRTRLEAPVVPGGSRVTLRILAREEPPKPASARLEIAAGERPLATVEVPVDRWATLDAGPFDWPAGAPLVLSVPHRGAPVVVDRVELRWQ